MMWRYASVVMAAYPPEELEGRARVQQCNEAHSCLCVTGVTDVTSPTSHTVRPLAAPSSS